MDNTNKDCNDIPYEIRMKYIIDAYRKDQEKWGKLLEYAKHLEAEVIRLKNILISNGCADDGKDTKPAQMIYELRAQVNDYQNKIKELKKTLKDKEIKRPPYAM